jgi:hypothetical protein
MLNADHYDANDLADIGKRFAEKYQEIISNTKTTP